MRGSRRIPAVHIAGLLTLLAIILLAVWVIGGARPAGQDGPVDGPDVDKGGQSAPPRHTKRSSAEGAQPQIPLSPAKVKDLGHTARSFVSAQYDRDPSLTVEQLRDRLSLVTTDGYLLRYPPSLSTESDKWVRRERGTIIAHANIEASDAVISETEALVYADVIVQGEAKNKTLPPYSFAIRLRMVWERGWKVDDVV